MLGLDDPAPAFSDPALPVLAARMKAARERGASVILAMGGHVIRAGVAAHLIDWMERGLVTHLAMNGGAAIHDYELSLIGATTESVARYVREGWFGLWEETGGVNEAAKAAAADGIGLGEALGRAARSFPHAAHGVLAAAHRLNVPATVHVGIGYDIVHEHPSCDGAAIGAASYTDFLVFAQSVAGLEGGLFLNLGTAVMGPEIYLKALAMARNVAHQEGRRVTDFTTAVFDLVPLGDVSREASKGDPRYFFRPFKTILVRTVAEGGESHYVRGPHRATLPALHRLTRDEPS
ncbi:MAG: hypothetical protein RLO52_10975 [Sandaracinaceae bacterium]